MTFATRRGIWLGMIERLRSVFGDGVVLFCVVAAVGCGQTTTPLDAPVPDDSASATDSAGAELPDVAPIDVLQAACKKGAVNGWAPYKRLASTEYVLTALSVPSA